MNKKEEIFTIGDKCEKGVISSFSVFGNDLLITYNNGSTQPLKNAVKSKVLFRSEDGVDIFDVSEKYYLVDDWSILPQTYNLKRGYKHFSTKEAAEEYIIMNKPCLSIKDLEELDVNIGSFDRVEIIKLVKSKL